MENWSWIEVAWTLVAVIGAYFSARNIIDGINDLIALRKLGAGASSIENQMLKIAAWGNTRRDSFRETIQLMFIGIGIWAGTLPNPVNPSVIGLIFQGILFICSLLLTLSAAGDHSDRVKMHALGKLLQVKSDDGV